MTLFKKPLILSNKKFLGILGRTFLFTAIALSLGSCMKEKPVMISDLKNPTTEDSLLYYFVQLRAHEYWQKIDNDTTLRSPEEREQFLKGLEDGIKAIKRGKDSYNNGVRMGTKLAKNLYQFEEYYHVTTDHAILLESFKTGLRGINDIPENEYQKKFYELLGRIKAKEHSNQMKEVRLALIAEAREQNLTKIAPDLYAKITRNGEGPKAHPGDEVVPTILYELADGDDLGLPSPSRVIIGADGIPEVMNQAFMQLNKGASGVFATTADAIFGTRTEIMGLKPNDILLLKITVNDLVHNEHPGDLEHVEAL